jgi:hypothetical protein
MTTRHAFQAIALTITCLAPLAAFADDVAPPAPSSAAAPLPELLPNFDRRFPKHDGRDLSTQA